MSDRWNSGSRWSSAREREERERAREAEREAQRQARRDRAAGSNPSENAGSGTSASRPANQRRLSEDERRTIREYRFPGSSNTAPEAPRDNERPARARPPANEPPPPTTDGDSPARPSPIGRKWRSSLESSGAGNGQPTALPDLPGSAPAPGGMRGASGRLLIFGAALFGLMAVVAYLPFGPFGGSGDPDPTPTPPVTRPSILDDATAPANDDARTPADTASGPPPDSEQVVCIDPGHGGWDPGWLRTDTEDPPYAAPYVTEAELNLGMAFMLRDALKAEGITVVMTRESGGAVNVFEEDVNGDGETRRTVDIDRADQVADRDELQARINICNAANADILISLHLNGFNDRAQRGYEILYTAAAFRPFGDLSEELGRYIYRNLDTAMRESDYGGGLGRDVKDDTQLDAVQHEFGTEDHLVLTGPAIDAPNYTIQPSEMPGVIVEGVFLSNDQDANFIVQPDNQRLVVDAYARGILEYFAQHPG